MMSKYFLILLISIIAYSTSMAQLAKFNIGLNARLAFLTHIGSGTTEYVDIYQGTPKDVIFSAPISFRYTTNSLISLRYQIEYRKEDFQLLDKYSDTRIESNCKYVINNLEMLFKLNKSETTNTSISIGITLFNSVSENYEYWHYGELNPGSGSQLDSTFSYNSKEFRHLKSSIISSINRETLIKNSRISIYREISLSVPIYRRKSNIPVFDSFEIGFTVGFCYNFRLKDEIK